MGDRPKVKYYLQEQVEHGRVALDSLAHCLATQHLGHYTNFSISGPFYLGVDL